MSAEYGRLEMVKLSVRVFRLSPIAAIRQGDRWLSLRADLCLCMKVYICV